MSKDELLHRVWPDTFVEEANLAYNVFALRKALGDAAEDATYSATVPKRGYQFKAPVTTVDEESRPRPRRREIQVLRGRCGGGGHGRSRPRYRRWR